MHVYYCSRRATISSKTQKPAIHLSLLQIHFWLGPKSTRKQQQKNTRIDALSNQKKLNEPTDRWPMNLSMERNTRIDDFSKKSWVNLPIDELWTCLLTYITTPFPVFKGTSASTGSNAFGPIAALQRLRPDQPCLETFAPSLEKLRENSLPQQSECVHSTLSGPRGEKLWHSQLFQSETDSRGIKCRLG